MLDKKIHNIRYALHGIGIAWQEEFSFRVQVFATGLVLILGWLFRISAAEWLSIILSIGFVLAAEAFNTALEELCDKFQSDPDPHIAKIKDLSAGAVLIASLTTLVVGIVIFVPKFISVL